MRSQISRIDEQRRLRPDRPMVTKWFGTWDVWIFLDGRVRVKEFPTHAEAIAHAQSEARLTCTACGRRMPYLEACIEFKPFCHPDVGQDCYTETTQRLTLERYSIPQKIVIGGQS